MKFLTRALERISTLALWISATGLIAMTLVIGWQVFGRKVLNASPAWSESLALLLTLYFVLLAAAVGVREDFHLRFRLLDNMVSEKAATMLHRFINLIIAGFGMLMASNGIALANFTSSHMIPTLGLSRAIAYWPFVIAGTLITVFALEHVVSPTDNRNKVT